ncbi:MAG: lysylphosphatidylglycerol synthase transmembrane domain-containing protein [Bacteroidota bacterium]
MSKSLKKVLRIIVPLSLGILLILFVYSKTSPSDRKAIVENIANADPLWILLSIGIGILSHLSRAIRWNYLLEPLGYVPKISNGFFIVMVAYLANLGVPRSGEFLRATALTTYEKVPFEKGFGTIVTERVVDLIMLLIIIIIALLLQTNFILGYLKVYGVNLAFSILALVLGILGLIVLLRFTRKAKSGFLLRLKVFFDGMLEGVGSILKMNKRGPFVFHTIFIWACYIGMFWMVTFAIPETQNMGLPELLVAFVAGAFAMMAFPGGLGGYPIFVSAALSLYGISPNSGDAFGWVMWISQTLMILVLGTISFLLLPLLNKTNT